LEKKRNTFYDDQPITNSNLFKINDISNAILEIILDNDVKTPFSICINGEWGSGKTSLLKLIQAKLENNSELTQEDNCKIKTLFFNAWEYERLDPVAALLYHIQQLYKTKTGKVKESLTGVEKVLFDIALKNNTNMKLKDIQSYFEQSISYVSTLREDIQEIVKEEGKLILLIDDLDRCIIDKTLEVLEALKLFLNVPNVIVILATDVEKLEKAWMLRYNNLSSSEEGLDQIDKIFQLKTALSEKEEIDLFDYMKELSTPYKKEIVKLIFLGCKSNPRRIKKVLNSLYFSEKFFEPIDDFQITVTILWYVLRISYPKFAKLIKDSVNPLIEMLIILYQFNNFGNFTTKVDHFMLQQNPSQSPSITLNKELSIPRNLIFIENDKSLNPETICVGKVCIKIIKHCKR
jgi:hypothetical protein